ncbi:MAG: hypothetical protein Q4A29_09130 [Eubacteriales bacterium]|nr:hypothetical protein [Eubacteriales bacterium]
MNQKLSNQSRVQRQEKICKLNRNKRNRQADKLANEIKILSVLVIAVVVVILLLPFSKDSIEAKGNFEKVYISVEVHSGDTVWGYAEKYAHKDYYPSKYDYIDEVFDLNRLEDATIYYGRNIVLPVIIDKDSGARLTR